MPQPTWRAWSSRRTLTQQPSAHPIKGRQGATHIKEPASRSDVPASDPGRQPISQSATHPPTKPARRQDSLNWNRFAEVPCPYLSITTNSNNFLDAAHARSPRASWQLYLAVASCDCPWLTVDACGCLWVPDAGYSWLWVAAPACG